VYKLAYDPSSLGLCHRGIMNGRKKIVQPGFTGACLPSIYPNEVKPMGSFNMSQFFTLLPNSSAQKLA